MTNARLSLFIVLTWFAPATAQGIVAAMYKDLTTVPVAVRPYTRYLSLDNIPEKGRAATADLLTGHLNSLSREIDLARPVLVGPLLRLNILDYGWTPELWDSLAETDPWYHVKTVTDVVKTWPAGKVWPGDGKSYNKAFTYWDKGVENLALAPWLADYPNGQSQLQQIVAGTESKAPVYRADWFVNQTGIQEGRKVGYYGFLGIKDEKSFQKLVRFNAETARSLEQNRVVVFSGITLQPRRVEVLPTVRGSLWRTFDSIEATDKNDPLTLLDNELQFDATEQFAPLLNGLPVWFLGNAKGESQVKAPDNIVQGDRTGHRSTALHVGISCLRCHFQAKHEQGIKDIEEIKIGRLKALDYTKYLELKRRYLRTAEPTIETIIKEDRQRYAVAIKATTGMDAQEYALAYQEFWIRYEDARVDADRAALDLGMSKEALLKGLRDYEAATDNLAPLLTVIMNGGAIPIRQWESVQPVVHLVLKGLVQP